MKFLCSAEDVIIITWANFYPDLAVKNVAQMASSYSKGSKNNF